MKRKSGYYLVKLEVTDGGIKIGIDSFWRFAFFDANTEFGWEVYGMAGRYKDVGLGLICEERIKTPDGWE